MTPEEIAALTAIIAPQFIGDPRMVPAVAMAEAEITEDHCYHDRVAVLLAAHMLAMADRGSGGGAVSSESEGGLARSFAVDTDAAGLGLTGYGREAQRLNFLCYGFVARTKMG